MPGKTEGLGGNIFRDSFQFIKDPSRLHNGDPPFRSTLALSHPSFSGFLGNRFVRKNSYPDLSPALYVPGNGNPGCFNLLGAHEAAFQSLQTVIAECQRPPPVCLASDPPFLFFAILDFLWTQHGFFLFTFVGEYFTVKDSHFYADHTIRCASFCKPVIYVSP